jgi:hypothetical protein
MEIESLAAISAFASIGRHDPPASGLFQTEVFDTLDGTEELWSIQEATFNDT